MTFDLEQIRVVHKSPGLPSHDLFSRLSLSVSSGECVGVLGREGAGKTTLLNLFGALTRPDAGAVTIDGMDPWTPRRNGPRLRRSIAYTFQFPDEQFTCDTVAGEFSRGGGPAVARTARSALRTAGLEPESVLARSPFTLSLGEARRLTLALALARRPRAAFLDEPTAGLDAAGFASALQVIAELRARRATVVFATHDVEFLAACAERVILLDEGGIVADGSTIQILFDESLLASHGYAMPGTASPGRQGRRSAGEAVVPMFRKVPEGPPSS
jgi:energy-coupling factor transporter ATP-binding protein EcfA2